VYIVSLNIRLKESYIFFNKNTSILVLFKMLKFSKRVEYALIALLEVAKHQEYDPVTARTIARNYHIPPEILGKVLQTLTRKELLESVQGVKGGYSLRRKLSDIKLLDVVEAVDGPVSLVNCTSGNLCDCSQQPTCNIKSPMEVIQMELAQFFNSISLSDLTHRYGDIFAMTGFKND